MDVNEVRLLCDVLMGRTLTLLSSTRGPRAALTCPTTNGQSLQHSNILCLGVRLLNRARVSGCSLHFREGSCPGDTWGVWGRSESQPNSPLSFILGVSPSYPVRKEAFCWLLCFDF